MDDLKTNLQRQYYFRHAKIAINATVKESATGVSQNASGTEVEVVSSRTKLVFLPTTPKTFKPGMAYAGQVCSLPKHLGTKIIKNVHITDAMPLLAVSEL